MNEYKSDIHHHISWYKWGHMIQVNESEAVTWYNIGDFHWL